MSPLPSLSPDISFQEAIAFTRDLLHQITDETLSDVEIEQAIAQLVQTMNGARGFFVTYLTDDLPLADRPPSGVLAALKTAPETVAGLLVKNVAMSTAMAITHERQQHPEMAQHSLRVQRRSLLLLEQLQLPESNRELQKLSHCLNGGEGDYQTFLERWGYDMEQRQAIQSVLENFSENITDSID
jgi:hypothetical protein